MTEIFYNVPPGIDPQSKDEDGLPMGEDTTVFSVPPRARASLQGRTNEEKRLNIIRTIHFLLNELEKYPTKEEKNA